ncbi:hypothetical protein C8R45DRAFT_1154928 [Mycena sanguinolenta]|nr:hypothetical protein C8R45DRAFT_1154928 [Mycena sanguinolenta]
MTELQVAPRSKTGKNWKQKMKFHSALSQDICARFPIELWDNIIDHLHSNKRALLTCSLVCSAWSASSRYHLFQNASIIRVHRRNFKSFCKLLASQRLNAYIGRLHLRSHFEDEHPSNGNFQFNEHFKCLPRLPRLKYLRLEYHYKDLHPEFSAALAQNFANVTDLELDSMSFDSFPQFVQFVNTLPMLRRISLNEVSWTDSPPEQTSTDDTPHAVRIHGNLTDVVAICGNGTAVPTLSFIPSQPFIRRLAVSIESFGRVEHMPLLSAALRALGPRLEHFILDLRHYDAVYESRECPHFVLTFFFLVNNSVPDLSHTTGLHTFKISGIRCDWSHKSVDLEWVTTLLSLLPGRSSRLERIVFIVDLCQRRGLDFLEWPSIRNRLARQSSLRQVLFLLSGDIKWATQAITMRLRPKLYTYTLRVVHYQLQSQRQYRYSLDMFDH